MKSILLAITLCASTICYSADDSTTPNHIIGIAGATGHNYALRRGFIDEGKTYACTIAHTSDKSFNKEILQQITHELFKKLLENPNDYSSNKNPFLSKFITLPSTYTIDLNSIIIFNQEYALEIRHKKTQLPGSNFSNDYAPKVHCLNKSTVYQSFKTSDAGLMPTKPFLSHFLLMMHACSNTDDIAKEIARTTNSLNELNSELIVTVRTTPKDQHDECAIS